MSDVVSKAIIFATNAHIAQKRKYTDEPYVYHCLEVADLLKMYCENYTDEIVCAAILHDTIEDTETTSEDILNNFGSEIHRMVMGLTDQATLEMGNRKFRKNFECERIAKENWDVQTIKCCDLISNTRSIVEHDKNFAIIYLREKRNLLNVMTKADENVRNFAFNVLKEAENKLKK